MDSPVRDIRLYVYAQMVATSAAPSAADTARALSCSPAEAEAAYQSLADAHVLVLRPGSTTIWMAMPFSNMQTAFTVIVGGRAYYAPCGWDAFGIPAALGADARIFTTCADCGGALERKVAGGNLGETRGVVHFARPSPTAWPSRSR